MLGHLLAGASRGSRCSRTPRARCSARGRFWDTIKELREVLAPAGSVRLSLLGFDPLDRIDDVYARVKTSEIASRAVIRP